ncbi:MAG: 50S ribosomal protein L13 [Phycisphaerales bacterium]|nr:50S ribosomal protein L13 [Phycisphaerales bacterium]
MRRETTYLMPGRASKPWRIVDAEGQPLGRLAAEIAIALMGKNRPEYTPFVDCGDNVVVINAKKVELKGNKAQTRLKMRYSGYPGGLKAETYGQVREKQPDRLISDAVRRMLPKNRLSRVMLSNLKIYADATHPHEDKKPTKLEI